MTDFTLISRDRTLSTVRVALIAIVIALVTVFLVTQVLTVARGETPYFDRFSWWVALPALIVAASAHLVRGSAVSRLARRAGASVTARWRVAPGLRAYYRSRRRTLEGGPYELPAHGAIVGTECGIELLSTSTARKIAWAWTDVRDVEVGRVESTSGRIMWGIVLTVTGPDGEDRIPLAVRPGIYRPFVSRAALTDLARTLRSSAGDRLMAG